MYTNPTMMRIQKYLSEQGIASRRQAEALIIAGQVLLNGKVVKELGIQIDPTKDRITLSGGAKNKLSQKETVIINKPPEITSSRKSDEGKTIYDLFPKFNHLDIVGRLDRASEGLLLLSNDGVVAKAITGDEHLTEKEYVVSVRETISPSKIKTMETGIKLDDGMTLPAKAKLMSPNQFSIVLREGRKHQIRRMCDYLQLTVTKLKRVRIGEIKLGNLKHGEFRTLGRSEVESLKKVVRPNKSISKS